MSVFIIAVAGTLLVMDVRHPDLTADIPNLEIPNGSGRRQLSQIFQPMHGMCFSGMAK